MQLQILLLIPALASFVWALYSKKKNKQDFDFTLILLSGIILFFNGLLMSQFFTGNIVSEGIRCVQQVFSSLIVPIAYMYFAKQMGRAWNSGTSITLWLLILLLIVPAFLFPLDGVQPNDGEHIRPMTMRFYLEGKNVFWLHTADFIILVQALVTFTRMVLLGYTFRRYNLALSPKVKYFLLWWLGAIVFIGFTSFAKTPTLALPVYNWIYYGVYSLLAGSIYSLLAQNFDLRPVMLAVDVERNGEPDDTDDVIGETEAESEEGIAVELDNFIRQSEIMASRVRQAMETERHYLQPEYSSDNMISYLGTNRTYFSRMMKAEFGCTFVEYLTRLRIETSEVLLADPNLTIHEIAEKSGFVDSSSFARRFRQTHDMSPSQWRKARNIVAE